MDAGKSGALRKGLLEFVVLAVVSSGRTYAADILQRLGDTEFATKEGTLYPLLSRMRRERLLEYEWQESEGGPPRKYYRLTPDGRRQLAAFWAYWKSLTRLIDELGTPPCKP